MQSFLHSGYELDGYIIIRLFKKQFLRNSHRGFVSKWRNSLIAALENIFSIEIPSVKFFSIGIFNIAGEETSLKVQPWK